MEAASSTLTPRPSRPPQPTPAPLCRKESSHKMSRWFRAVYNTVWLQLAEVPLKDVCTYEIYISRQYFISIFFFSLVTQSCPTFCNPMDCNTPGILVHHQFPELAQTHVHQVSDAIQSSYPLSSPSLPPFSLSQIRVFSNESFLHIRWPKYWSFSFSISPSNEYSGLISFML